jgi:hypothetical protein
MEAENYDNNDTSYSAGNWTEDTSYTGYVGDGYMVAPTDADGNGTWSGSPTGGAELGYDIEFETAGTYYVWMRRYCTTASQNSCFVGLDGTQITGYQFDNRNDGLSPASWTWINRNAYNAVVSVYVSAGSHTFQIRRKETDYRPDRIILTTDSGYTPSGTGPAESSRQ